MRGDEFMAIEGKIDFKESERDSVQLRRLDRPQDDAADGFENAVNPFDGDASPKAFVQQRFAPAPGRMRECFRGMDGDAPFGRPVWGSTTILPLKPTAR